MVLPYPGALQDLALLSARIGADPEQVQAAGGNTSVKLGGTMWVKASGLRLADAAQRSSFVPMDLNGVRRAIDGGDEQAAKAMARPALAPANLPVDGLRPSIEASLHALMPQPVVVHTHSVRAIAVAIRADAQQALAGHLEGLNWAWVPYVMPGLPLTLAIRGAALAKGGAFPDVLVLGNHGLVVAGETVADAEALLADVERRLEPRTATPAAGRLATYGQAKPALEGRATPSRYASGSFVIPPDGETLTERAQELFGEAEAWGLEPAEDPAAHGLAASETAVRIATAASYYPDHVVFLGPAAVRASDLGEAAELVAEARSKLAIVPGSGAFLPREVGRSAHELAGCLGRVLARVPAGVELVGLGGEAETALLGWEAEAHRRSLAR